MTVYSMTGYATASMETPIGNLTLELKSVNSRFLDLQFRVNDELRAYEGLLREGISKRIARGKLECRLSFGKKLAQTAMPNLNLELVDKILAAQELLQQKVSGASALSIHELLRWPGVMDDPDQEQLQLNTQLSDLLEQVIEAFLQTRQREGEALTRVLLDRVTAMEAIVARITPLMPEVVAQFQQKATSRLQEALGLALTTTSTTTTQATPIISREEALERIRQEVTLYGIRIDVAEELARLAAHLHETRSILTKGGQVGKRLDFMMQELNREANTLGSKAAIKELADASMELKLLIEQMREQVQNLE